MSEIRIATYIVGWDEGDMVMPLAATLTKARADQLVTEIEDHLVGEARRRWEVARREDPGIRPFDEDAVRDSASIEVTAWDLPFIPTEDPTDPAVFELAVKHIDEFDGELFET